MKSSPEPTRTLRDPVAIISEVRDRLNAWADASWSLWLRSPDSEDHLHNQARNLLALAEKLDQAIAGISGQPEHHAGREP